MMINLAVSYLVLKDFTIKFLQVKGIRHFGFMITRISIDAIIFFPSVEFTTISFLSKIVEYLNSLCICKTSRHVISGRTRELGIVGKSIILFGDVDIIHVRWNVPFGDVFTRYSRL